MSITFSESDQKVTAVIQSSYDLPSLTKRVDECDKNALTEKATTDMEELPELGIFLERTFSSHSGQGLCEKNLHFSPKRTAGKSSLSKRLPSPCILSREEDTRYCNSDMVVKLTIKRVRCTEKKLGIEPPIFPSIFGWDSRSSPTSEKPALDGLNDRMDSLREKLASMSSKEVKMGCTLLFQQMLQRSVRREKEYRVINNHINDYFEDRKSKLNRLLHDH